MHEKTQIHISRASLNNEFPLKDLVYAIYFQVTFNMYREILVSISSLI